MLVKFNLDDGLDGGSTLEDAVWLAGQLEAAGANALIPSGGLVQRTAFYLLRGGLPLREMARGESSLMTRWAMAGLGRWLVKPYRYESGFFMDAGAQIVANTALPVAALGGVDSADVVDNALARGFQLIVMGRALLADPDFVERLASGERVVSRCNHCNRCVATMNDGISCVEFATPAEGPSA